MKIKVSRETSCQISQKSQKTTSILPNENVENLFKMWKTLFPD